MAADSARLKGLANLKKVDIQYPIEKASYKVQKKKNKGDMAEKKELIEEGAKISLNTCPLFFEPL